MRYTLVSHALCPYVQRAAIVLAEKGVPFRRVTIDLADKPDWFRAISPLGKVPLLIVCDDAGRETVLFESAVICEYLEETAPGVRLHPADPLERARARAWIELGSAILADIWGLETAHDAATYDAKRSALTAKFATVEAAIAGPFFAGDRFTLVDAVFGPIFRYFDVFDGLLDTGVFAATPKARAWRRRLHIAPASATPSRLTTPSASAPFSNATTPTSSKNGPPPRETFRAYHRRPPDQLYHRKDLLGTLEPGG